MFRHMLKLAWKRKSRNLMLTLEILIAFLVVFAIAGFAVRTWQLVQLPIGFSTEQMWSVRLRDTDDGNVPAPPELMDNFLRALRAMPQIEGAALSGFPPYSNASWNTTFEAPDTRVSVPANLMLADDAFPGLAGLHLVEGRMYGPQDDGGDATPVVVNRRFARAMFPGKGAIGQRFQENRDNGKPGKRFVVTGMVDELRLQGEFMSPVNFMLQRTSSADIGSQRHILVKVRPGTPRDFEAALMRQLKNVRSDWGYEVTTLAEARTVMARAALTPLMILAIVAAFLLLMVAFGLFGVLWQNTTRRIPEIGLRRALGADAGQIYRQIIAEQMLLSSIAMGLALVLLVQVPITGALGEAMNWTVFAAATLLSMAVIYLISLLCSLYPGWRASRLSPTEALHYE